MSDTVARTKPPLTAGQKATAAFAGILGFLFTTVGFTLAMAAVSVGSLVTWLVSLAGSKALGSDSETAAKLLRAIGRALQAATIPLVVVGIVGAILWILGLFVSRGILRRGSHYRPWGVTWLGLLIASVLSWVATAIGALVAAVVTPAVMTQVARTISRGGDPNGQKTLQPIITEATVYGIVFLVVTILLGWIAWSISARALRPTAEQRAIREQKQADRATRIADRERSEADAAALPTGAPETPTAPSAPEGPAGS